MKRFFKSFLKILTLLSLLILDTIAIYIVCCKLGFIDYRFNYFEKKKTVDEYINNGLSLKDPKLEIVTGTESEYYYNQLDDYAKVIYQKILQNKDKLKTGTEELKFSDGEFNKLLSEKDGMEKISDAYQDAVDALRYDHVEIFYIDFTKMTLKTLTYTLGDELVSSEVTLRPADGEENYLGKDIKQEELESLEIMIEIMSDEIIESAEGTDYEKIQYVHNWLVDNVQYDTTYKAENNRNICGTLINKTVVCEGYSKTFKYILDKMKIPCILVSGNATNSEETTESHMWNYVKINDQWYAFDVTWDDPILTNTDTLPDKYRYKYFCQGDNINENHFLEPQITEGGKEFEYPELYHKE